MRVNLREVAFKVTLGVSVSRHSLAELFPEALPSLNATDKAFVQALCYETLRFYLQTDAVLRTYLQKPLRNKDQDILTLLILALTEIYFLKTPDYAVGAEWVKLIPSKKSWAKGLVNGLLRQFTHDKTRLEKTFVKFQKVTHPVWMAKALKEAWPSHWQAILAANDKKAPMALRVNTQKCSREDYFNLLMQQAILAELSPFSPCGILLTEPVNVAQLPKFKEGWVSIQDEAAQLAAIILNPAANERILDACAAPGGKACHLLERDSTIDLVVCDLSLKRLSKVEENLSRSNYKAPCYQADILCPASWGEWANDSFDKILLDAPCSATGVIRRHPDIKLLRQPDDLEALARTQLQMLHNLWPLLKKGGQLLYATCSVFPEENENVIDAFLQAQLDAKIQAIELAALKHALGQKEKFGLQLFPRISSHDGFYYALLSKL